MHVLYIEIDVFQVETHRQDLHGTYHVGSDGGALIRLEGAFTLGNVGPGSSAHVSCTRCKLTIALETATLNRDPITPTLTWNRIGQV